MARPKTDRSEWITLSAASRELALSRWDTMALCATGRLQAREVADNRVEINVASLKRYIAAQGRVKATTGADDAVHAG